MAEFRRGRFGIGWELWEGKPLLGFYRVFYDWWNYALHIGPLWIEWTAHPHRP